MKKSILVLAGLLASFACVVHAQSAPGKVHTYYIAADEVDWDYAPDRVNKMMGMKFDGYAATFMHRGMGANRDLADLVSVRKTYR